MCNLYSLTKGQAAIIATARAMRDTTGNLPPLRSEPVLSRTLNSILRINATLPSFGR
jgi:hypothetical protein